MAVGVVSGDEIHGYLGTRELKIKILTIPWCWENTFPLRGDDAEEFFKDANLSESFGIRLPGAT
jgi:hypothetical protein